MFREQTTITTKIYLQAEGIEDMASGVGGWRKRPCVWCVVCVCVCVRACVRACVPACVRACE